MSVDYQKILTKTRIVDASDEQYDHDKYPTLWYFYFPNMPEYPNLPTQMGEHGETKEAATSKIIERLKGIMGQ